MDWTLLLEKVVWFGIAAIGFAVLFNVPVRTLPATFILGAVGGFCKLFLLEHQATIILASLAGSLAIGLLSISTAHIKHAPPLVFSTPAVIPMVPGILAYRMMLGLIKLAGDVTGNSYNSILNETVNNGLKVMLILMSLAGGVAIPMLIARKESVKHLRLRKRITGTDKEKV